MGNWLFNLALSALQLGAILMFIWLLIVQLDIGWQPGLGVILLLGCFKAF